MKNERKEELKDEMKNRISLALKDPILQQGFEIICKENAELKEQCSILADCNTCTSTCKTENIEMKKQLTNAKEIIKMLHSDCYSIAECEDTNIGLWENDLAKAEQFLKDCEAETKIKE